MSAIPVTSASAQRRRKQAVRLATELLWHLTMITICIVILIPIFLVILGSFKSVPTAKPGKRRTSRSPSATVSS